MQTVEAGRPSGGCLSGWSQEVTGGLVTAIDGQDGAERSGR